MNGRIWIVCLLLAASVVPEIAMASPPAHRAPAKLTRRNGKLKQRVCVKGRVNGNGHYVRGHYAHE